MDVKKLWSWMLIPALVLMLGMSHQGHCQQGPRPARLVGYWMVDNGTTQQLLWVRPDLTVDYGVDDLTGRLQLKKDGTLAWSTQDDWYGTEREMKLEVLRWCGSQTMTMVVARDSAAILEVGQRVVWSRLDDSAGGYFSLSHRDESQ
ncbi:MAG: hypothetical protein AMXMBFR33_68860 [Candidatus Xenobia bacterium]